MGRSFNCSKRFDQHYTDELRDESDQPESNLYKDCSRKKCTDRCSMLDTIASETKVITKHVKKKAKKVKGKIGAKFDKLKTLDPY